MLFKGIQFRKDRKLVTIPKKASEFYLQFGLAISQGKEIPANAVETDWKWQDGTKVWAKPIPLKGHGMSFQQKNPCFNDTQNLGETFRFSEKYRLCVPTKPFLFKTVKERTSSLTNMAYGVKNQVYLMKDGQCYIGYIKKNA